LFIGAPHGDRLPANSVQKWSLAENPICARVYRVKTTVSVGVTGFPRGDDSEEVPFPLEGISKGDIIETLNFVNDIAFSGLLNDITLSSFELKRSKSPW
jgi:hypothetical protein